MGGGGFDTAYSIMSIPVGLETQNMEYLNQAHDKSVTDTDIEQVTDVRDTNQDFF